MQVKFLVPMGRQLTAVTRTVALAGERAIVRYAEPEATQSHRRRHRNHCPPPPRLPRAPPLIRSFVLPLPLYFTLQNRL